ncbi:hypothetical protein Acsp04_64990 [Actinomadura sp. NBRC 104425]|nr:hypothetical protein Acsp04_64990 [Actinomadura sp. NBRC 104425]
MPLTFDRESVLHWRWAARVIPGCVAAAGGNVKEGNRGMPRQKMRCGSAVEWMRGEPMTWRRAYLGRLDQVAAARQFAATLFAGSGHEADVAFIVTELATNAIRHSRSGDHGGWFGLDLIFADVATIGVSDLGGGKVPTVLPEPPGGEPKGYGQGLRAVSKLAVALGVHGRPDYGHTVWAEVDMRVNETIREGLATTLTS